MFIQRKTDFNIIKDIVEAAERLQMAGDINRSEDVLLSLSKKIDRSLKQRK